LLAMWLGANARCMVGIVIANAVMDMLFGRFKCS
jgi:hypothetical protein